MMGNEVYDMGYVRQSLFLMCVSLCRLEMYLRLATLAHEVHLQCAIHRSMRCTYNVLCHDMFPMSIEDFLMDSLPDSYNAKT
jgi:hypothetical protein